MNNIFTSKEAINAAIIYAGLQNDNPRCANVLHRNSMYELTVCTTFQRYDFYVGDVSGEIYGINVEPMLDIEDACGRIAA